MLPKRERLTREREIKAVIKSKQYEGRSPLFYLVAQENGFGFSRLAVVAPKKLGNAVKRNQIRRRIAEIFGKIKPKISLGLDLVVFPKLKAMDKSYADLGSNFYDILRKRHICVD